jgi:hypothetical protein
MTDLTDVDVDATLTGCMPLPPRSKVYLDLGDTTSQFHLAASFSLWSLANTSPVEAVIIPETIHRSITQLNLKPALSRVRKYP